MCSGSGTLGPPGTASVCTGTEIATVSELRADLWCELWQPGCLCSLSYDKGFCSLLSGKPPNPAVSVSNPTQNDEDKKKKIKLYSQDIII